jgi:hypothetical protein
VCNAALLLPLRVPYSLPKLATNSLDLRYLSGLILARPFYLLIKKILIKKNHHYLYTMLDSQISDHQKFSPSEEPLSELISSSLRSGFEHPLTRSWQSERQISKVSSSNTLLRNGGGLTPINSLYLSIQSLSPITSMKRVLFHCSLVSHDWASLS